MKWSQGAYLATLTTVTKWFRWSVSAGMAVTVANKVDTRHRETARAKLFFFLFFHANRSASCAYMQMVQQTFFNPWLNSGKTSICKIIFAGILFLIANHIKWKKVFYSQSRRLMRDDKPFYFKDKVGIFVSIRVEKVLTL